MKNPLTPSHLPRRLSTPILSLMARIIPPPDPNSKPMAPSHTTMILTLVRLVEQATDIVITFNIPTIPDSSEAQDESVAREIISKVVTSFEIKDWNLFNGE